MHCSVFSERFSMGNQGYVNKIVMDEMEPFRAFACRKFPDVLDTQNLAVMILTRISLASFLWDIGKQNSPRCDAAECGVPSGAILFAYKDLLDVASSCSTDCLPKSDFALKPPEHYETLPMQYMSRPVGQNQQCGF